MPTIYIMLLEAGVRRDALATVRYFFSATKPVEVAEEAGLRLADFRGLWVG